MLYINRRGSLQRFRIRSNEVVECMTAVHTPHVILIAYTSTKRILLLEVRRKNLKATLLKRKLGSIQTRTFTSVQRSEISLAKDILSDRGKAFRSVRFRSAAPLSKWLM